MLNEVREETRFQHKSYMRPGMASTLNVDVFVKIKKRTLSTVQGVSNKKMHGKNENFCIFRK